LVKILNRELGLEVFSKKKGRGAIWNSTGSYISLVLLGKGVEGVTELEWMR
jgi:hypothetical protein